MKSLINNKITFILIALLFVAIKGYGQAVVTDPGLTTAIIVGGQSERKVLNNINDKHNKIVAMQTIIGTNLDRMRSYEEKIYGYLLNVSDAVKQSFEIKRAAEMTVEIKNSFQSCAKAASKHPKGVIYTSIVAKKTSKLTKEMLAIYSYINSIALNKNTLLNSAERQLIISEVLYRLERINSEILLLQFQIENYTLADLPQVLFPEQYFMFKDGERIANKIISDYSRKK